MRYIGKKAIIFICATCIVLSIPIFQHLKQKKINYALNNLFPSQIESISIYSRSTLERTILSENDKERVIELLEDVRFTGSPIQDISNYDGLVSRMFYIKCLDNTSFDFSVSGAIYVIDGTTGYEADYSVSERIAQIYYDLINQHEYAKELA